MKKLAWRKRLKNKKEHIVYCGNISNTIFKTGGIKIKNMTNRFQNSNWIVKLWRLRHYTYIPFKYIWYMYIRPMKIPETEYDHELCMVTPNNKVTTPNNKQLWSILIGSAQCDMKWIYTTEEAMSKIKR